MRTSNHYESNARAILAWNLLVFDGTRRRRTALDLAAVGSQVKSEFFSKVSHELRMPLNGVIGMGGEG